MVCLSSIIQMDAKIERDFPDNKICIQFSEAINDALISKLANSGWILCEDNKVFKQPCSIPVYDEAYDVCKDSGCQKIDGYVCKHNIRVKTNSIKNACKIMQIQVYSTSDEYYILFYNDKLNKLDKSFQFIDTRNYTGFVKKYKCSNSKNNAFSYLKNVDQNTKEIGKLLKKLLPVIKQINIDINKTANKNKCTDSTQIKSKTKCTVSKKKANIRDSIRNDLFINDSLIIRDDIRCRNGHIPIGITGLIPVITKNGKIVTLTAPISYCPICKKYYISEHVYKDLKKENVIACKVLKSPEHELKKNNAFSTWSAQSLLMAYGYTVKKESKLSLEQRRAILVNIIDNKILSKDQVLSYLDLFQRINPSDQAKKCWQDDIVYVLNYNFK